MPTASVGRKWRALMAKPTRRTHGLYKGVTAKVTNSLQLRFIVNAGTAEEEVLVEKVRVERRQGL